MTTENAIAGDATEDAADVSNSDSVTLHSGDMQTITPAQRWMLICEDVYARGQKRGFVGGDPLQDLVDAEQEIDATYETDFESVFSQTSTAKITEQLKALFACYGFDHEHLDSLLDGHQEGLARLAAMNRELLGNTSRLATKQTEVLKDVASEAVKTLQSLTEGRFRPEGVLNVAELSLQTLDHALAGFQSLSQSASIVSADQPQEASGQELLQDTIVRAYKGCSAKELMVAPVTAIKGISNSLGKRLEEEFAISSIRDMANHPHAVWARGIALLADAQRLAEDRSSRQNDDRFTADAGHRQDSQSVADSPLTRVREISESRAKLLREAFGIVTVRDLATNRYFDIARAIVMLAESED